MRELAYALAESAPLAEPSDLIIGQTTAVTVCVALMIWLGLLGRPGRPTLLWTLGFILALLGSYGSLASAAMGTDVLLHPVGIGITFGMPMLIWSGLRAMRGKRAYPWIGFAQSLVTVLILSFTTLDPAGFSIFQWLFLATAIGSALGAAEVLGGQFRGSRFATPLIAASAAMLLLATVGVAGSAVTVSSQYDLLFVRGAVMVSTIYILCATVSLLFLANRRQGANDVLDALDAFNPPPLMRAIVRERLLRAVTRHEQSWSFIDIRLDDALDLREATGEAAFATMVARFERILVAAVPAEVDLCRITPGHVTVFTSQPPAAVRELLRTVLNETAAVQEDAPTSLRTSASAGIVAVVPGVHTYETLLAEAAAAADQAQLQGGDRWSRAATPPPVR
ncbi:hypothetical protein [uncultured Microbacterium sp.]|uniref:hypothetical protein n=1 Tax=uncultured Microbacterium sp. TaxID=191216 RepID=UPI0035C94C3A